MSESVDPSELGDSIRKATQAMQQLTDTFNAGVAQDVAEHPDLAELNVQMDGFYGDPAHPDEETPA
ncbi:hypothetical protein L0F81_17230 [Streptomyces tricolor]|uniref:Uncharacterized protein n=1 Tax=Streptomyces tricolor TaxID=68277 RepID=A0ABS9JHH1_9ACTN|nr:hypothetical protein [Streptomyces tricolor]MCG0065017.1 hypothetical protein [Streptomyces tricolor]